MFPPPTRNSWKPYAETIVNRQEPTETSRCVRKPASRSRSSRSRPTAPPSPAATTTRKSSSDQVSEGISRSSIERRLLRRANLGDPLRAEVEQLVELSAVERSALGRRLHLDEAFGPGHDDVQVDLRARVLDVIEIEQQLAADDPERDRSHRLRQRAREAGLAERPSGGDPRTGDRRAAGAAVGLEHVAVDPERPLAERLEVEHRAQRAPDHPLDLDRAALLLAGACLALRPLAGRGRQHRVLGRQPAAALVAHPARDALVERCRAGHLRLALRVEHRPHRLLEVVDQDLNRPQLVRPTSLSHATTRSATATCSTSPSGSCRKRSPSARKAAGSPVVRKRYEPPRPSSCSMPLRASVSATSRAVSSAEKTSVTPRPKTRWKIGRISG